MHELGIVFHIIKSVEEVAKENNVTKVTSVVLDIGEVSTIVNSYLEDCWKWAVKKSPVMENCALKINVIKGVTICEDCGKTYDTVTYGKECPFCKSSHTHLIDGDQVNIKEIEVL